MNTKGAQSVDYRIEKRDAVRVIGKRIQLKPALEGMCKNGTIHNLTSLMDTEIYGLMGVSECNENEEWEYYIAVASTKTADGYEELLIQRVHGKYSIKKDQSSGYRSWRQGSSWNGFRQVVMNMLMHRK